MALDAAAAAAITAFVVGLGIARELARAHDDQVMWWRLGLTRRERAPILASTLLAAVATGLLVGAFAAWLLSPVGPVGNVRSIAASPGRDIAGRRWAPPRPGARGHRPRPELAVGPAGLPLVHLASPTPRLVPRWGVRR